MLSHFAIEYIQDGAYLKSRYLPGFYNIFTVHEDVIFSFHV